MPSWRYARVVSAIFSVGKSAKQIEMSIAVMISSVIRWNFSTSKVSSLRRNFSRLMLARLHDELSRWTYSEHGLLALIRPDSGQVCQPLMAPSYWMPGSAHSQAALATLRKRSRASTVSRTSPVCRDVSPTVPPRSMSKPASRRMRILSSSRALVSMYSPTSGWSTSRTTILAARRVAPPDLMVPADASAPRMNDTGPDAVPPEDSSSLEERMRERFRPAPEPPLKIRPSSRYQLRIDSIVSSTDRMKHAETCWGEAVPTLNHTGELKLNTWCNSMRSEEHTSELQSLAYLVCRLLLE